MPDGLADLYISAIGSGLFLLVVVAWLVLRRYLAVRSQSEPGLVRLSWEVERPAWRQYLKSKLGSMVSTILIWLVLYALLMAALSQELSENYWERVLIFGIYALALLVPTAAIVYVLAYFLPGRYVLTERGVGMIAWTPLLMRPGIGFLDLGFKPWDRIEQYRFEDDILVLKGSRGFLSQGISELVVPADKRKAVEELLKERKLARLKGPLVQPPKRPTRPSPRRRKLPPSTRRKG